MITLWGSRRSGKTVFLVALHDAITKGYDSSWMIQAANDASTNFINERRSEIFDDKKWPKPTDPKDRNRVFQFEVQVKSYFGFKKRSFRFDFEDPAGELFENPAAAVAYDNPIFERIGATTGMIFLLDPFRENKNEFFRLLTRNFTALKRAFTGEQRGFRQIDIPVAVCLSKMDRRPQFLKKPKEFAIDFLGKQNARLFETYFTQYRFFATSSVGMNKAGKSNLILGPDGELYPTGELLPFGLFEAAEWVVDHIGPEKINE